MKFVLTPVGSAGDVHPFIGIGRALRARGHDVVIVTAGAFEQTVTRAGLGFRETVSAEIFNQLSKHPDLWNSFRGLRLVLGSVASYLQLGYERVAELYEPGRTVLVGHALSFGTRLFEEKHHAPAATLHLAPSIFRSDFEQPAIAPGRDLTRAPRWVKRSFWWAADRFLSDPLIVPKLNAARRELGLAPVSRVFRHWLHSPRRVIALFPDWFAPPQPDWPPALCMAGFPQYDESDQQQLSPGLLKFLDAGEAPIVFTPGSANQNAASFFRAAVDASARLNRRALLLTRFTEHLPTLPATVHHEGYAPLSRLLPRSAALVHHGGIGTLAQALAAGVPQLTMPMGFDQPDNTTRLLRLGVAKWIAPSGFTGDRVASLLDGLLSEPSVASACAKYAALLRNGSALDRTCDLLEELGTSVRFQPDNNGRYVR
jgi:UDP:flavonoid glycosyltransferase YjiC (YdhE family)